MRFRPDAPPFWEVRSGGGPVTQELERRARPVSNPREKDVSDREPAKYLMASGCRRIGYPSDKLAPYR